VRRGEYPPLVCFISIALKPAGYSLLLAKEESTLLDAGTSRLSQLLSWFFV